MNTPIKKSGFTLIEVIVALTILSIIMISVMMIFVNSTQLGLKIDINRAMQENIKNVVETIAEDVRTNGVTFCPSDRNCYQKNTLTLANHIKSKSLYTPNADYYLAQKITSGTGTWTRVEDSDISVCQDINHTCSIVKSGKPLTNSSVIVKDMNFYITAIPNSPIAKITITFAIAPAPRRGVRAELIQNNTIYFQTTLSERIIRTTN